MKTFLTYNKALYHIFLIVSLIPVHLAAQDQELKKIIYETDMCLDVDDAGALAILHAMANNGEAEILAVCFNEVHPHGVAAIDAMNTWYGRGDIPVGIYRGNLDNPDGSAYLEHVAKYPHDLEDADAPSALEVYRQVLSGQPDSSVTIVSVGFTNNLNDLLIAEPELVAQKVKELVQMAGVINDGFNLVRHNLVSTSENVIENWPTKLVISQEGWDIYTGDNYANASDDNPYREAFYRFFGGNYEGRSSWDEMAVLYGVRGLGSYFREISNGSGSLSNGYTWSMVPGRRTYLSNKLSNSSYEQIIEDLMDQPPIGAYFNVSEASAWLPATIEFDASATNVGGNRQIQKYLWDFGDGAGGEGANVHHEYTDTGTFNVELTVIDSENDSLHATDVIRVSDPVFSTIPHFGSVLSYERHQENLWSTRMDSNDMRYFLSNEKRDLEIIQPGFSFVKDSIYSDFSLNVTVRTGEDLSESSVADYTIIFGYEDEKNFNKIVMKNSSARVTNVNNGQSIYVKGTGRDGIPDEAYHELQVALSGDQLTISLDDSVFLTATSARLQQEGKVGFGSDQYAVFFDDITISGSSSSTGLYDSEQIPQQFALEQNYPNPFNPKTTISYRLLAINDVELSIFDVRGQKVTTLIDEIQQPGRHTIHWNASDHPSGIYYYRLMVKDQSMKSTGQQPAADSQIKKMVLIK